MLETLTNWIAELPPGTGELIGTWVAALLTLAVLSYILGNNPAFRVAEYLFVGIAAGYAAALSWTQMLWPRLQLLLSDPLAHWPYGVFFLLGILLLGRGLKFTSSLANLPLGVLFGTGAALALGGALTGSLVPQIGATFISMNPAQYGQGLVGWAFALDALLLVVGTIAVLSYFHFAGRGQGRLQAVWHGLLGTLGSAGRGLIMIVFGALFAGAVLSFFTILNSRLVFLRDWIAAAF
ncbi:MAG: hypothetical protein A2Y73_09090 [Chloroflexi bacterium RBG_13_56_8]|nr:MAG: hypothetical protein A2Y73_09090 [Chloroflexi bacterium RBG_13_56_8]